MGTKETILSRRRPSANAPSRQPQSQAPASPTTQPGDATMQANVGAGHVPQSDAAETASTYVQGGPVVDRPVDASGIVQAAEKSETGKSVTEPKPQSLSYAEMYKMLNEDPNEDLERERKRAKRRAIFAAIGDGVSALANMYYTSRGALSTQKQGQPGMSRQNNDRWNEYERDVKKRIERYNADLLNAAKLDDEAKRYVDSLNYKRQEAERNYKLKENADRRADAKAERDAAKAALDRDLMAGRISKMEAQAKEAEINAKYADALNQSKIATQKSATARNYSTANKNNSRGGSGNKYYGTINTEDGETAYKTAADYNKTAISEAYKRGIDPYRHVVTYEEWDTEHRFPKEERVLKKGTELAAEVERYDKENSSKGSNGGKSGSNVKAPYWGTKINDNNNGTDW